MQVLLAVVVETSADVDQTNTRSHFQGAHTTPTIRTRQVMTLSLCRYCCDVSHFYRRIFHFQLMRCRTGKFWIPPITGLLDNMKITRQNRSYFSLSWTCVRRNGWKTCRRLHFVRRTRYRSPYPQCPRIDANHVRIQLVLAHTS